MAAEPDEGILKNIQNYATELRQLREQWMETDESPQDDLETRLQETVEDLQDRLRRQQAELEKASNSNHLFYITTPARIALTHF
jgi:hypothetical protein